MSATIAILMPGDMGHGVGAALLAHGHPVVTSLDGRSAHTRMLADRAGLRDAGSLDDAVSEADIVLSILPPDAALKQAEAVAKAFERTGARPVYVDCNAVSPQTAEKVGGTITSAGAPFLDCGIIGLHPGKGTPTRFYVSGTDPAPMLDLDGKGIRVVDVGRQVGRASALKMVYAALTKGTWALQLALLMTALKLDVLEPLLEEFAFSQAGPLEGMQGRLPALPADAGRWVGEMEEIAATFASAGVSSKFHEGAADIFRVLARTPFAEETRETIDRTRSLETALAEFIRHLDN